METSHPDNKADPSSCNSEDEIRLSTSPFFRALLIAIGSIFLLLGLVGIFLPVLPTTPFLLLTAACYARGSETSYRWLLNSPLFGNYIRDWREHRSLPLKSKVVILSLLWATISLTAVYAIPSVPAKMAMFLVPIGVTLLFIRIPTRQTRE